MDDGYNNKVQQNIIIKFCQRTSMCDRVHENAQPPRLYDAHAIRFLCTVVTCLRDVPNWVNIRQIVRKEFQEN